jgi:hypothetical protein
MADGRAIDDGSLTGKNAKQQALAVSGMRPFENRQMI